MKAEHRKELHTNALADRMGKLVQGVRSGPQSSSVVAWVIAVLALGTFLFWYFASGTNAGRSALWAKLYGDTNLTSLEALARENRGTFPARTAQFQEARRLLQTGLERFAEQRPEAIKELEKARDLYQGLQRESRDNPVLMQETLLGMAKAEEALVGVPKEKADEGYRGNLNTALGYYQRFLESLGKTDPDGSLYKAVDAHVKELEKNPAAVEEFYVRLNKIATAKDKSLDAESPHP